MRRAVALVTLLLAGPGSARADGWQVFKSDRFGFAMLVAPGTAWVAKDWGDGWGGIRAEKGVLAFVAIVKMGSFATPADLERDAIALTRVWMFWYGTGRPHLLYEPIDRRSRVLGVVIVAVPALVYLAAIVLAGSAPRVSLWIYGVVPLIYLVGAWRARKAAPPGWAESEA